jgi:hypothetical protein
MIGLNEKQAAEILGKKPQTLRNDRHNRKGPPYVKLGRSVRYLEEDLREYMRKNRIDPERPV